MIMEPNPVGPVDTKRFILRYDQLSFTCIILLICEWYSPRSYFCSTHHVHISWSKDLGHFSIPTWQNSCFTCTFPQFCHVVGYTQCIRMPGHLGAVHKSSDSLCNLALWAVNRPSITRPMFVELYQNCSSFFLSIYFFLFLFSKEYPSKF